MCWELLFSEGHQKTVQIEKIPRVTKARITRQESKITMNRARKERANRIGLFILEEVKMRGEKVNQKE